MKIDVTELISKFKHTTNGYVKFHEVDAFRVVHNLRFLEWNEVARVEYCMEVGIDIFPNAAIKTENFQNKTGNSADKIENFQNKTGNSADKTGNFQNKTGNSADKTGKFSVFLVHNEVDYFNPAVFNEKYVIYTRISRIGRSSCDFEHVITKVDGTLLCINRAVEVYVDGNNVPIEIDFQTRSRIIAYEKVKPE